MNKLIAIIFLVVLLIGGGYLFIRRGENSANNANKRLQVSTSFYPLYFFSSQIGLDKAEVYNITPSGAEPHDYEPTARQIARIEKGNMLILNGGVEAWGDKIQENLKGTKVKVTVVGEGLLTKQFIEEGKPMRDPHIWLDPILAKKEVAKITDAYIVMDSQNTLFYQENEKKLEAKLDTLDQKYRQDLSNCQSHDIITSHAAFGYLASRYGLRQVAVSGLSPDEEPSAQQLAKVADFAKKNNVSYIFFESLISPKLSETIASEIGAKTLVLDPLEGLADNDSKQGRDYFTVMEENLKNLRIALTCNQ